MIAKKLGYFVVVVVSVSFLSLDNIFFTDVVNSLYPNLGVKSLSYTVKLWLTKANKLLNDGIYRYFFQKKLRRSSAMIQRHLQ